MSVAPVVVTTVLAHAAFNGTRLTISLDALALGASALTVGVLMSLFAALPMLLAVPAGRLLDRVGVRVPLIVATACLVLSVLLPAALPGMAMLYVASAAVGTSFMLFHIGVQHAIGEMSRPENRRDNFGWLALGFSISNFAGPTIAGTSIDHFGHRATFCLLALSAFAALALLVWWREGFPHREGVASESARPSTLELLRNAELRRVFIVSGMLAAAWDLFVFVTPIYGTSIGLSATTIGLILGAFAAATILIRLALPWLSRQVREWPMITATFAIAAVGFAIFPMMREVGLLAATSFLLGLGLGATQPSIMALIYASAPAGRAGEAVGVRSVVLNISSTFLPLAFGGIGAALGMLPVFWTMAGALAAGGVFADRRRRSQGGHS
jgi:predicted MFS family arabinose efflux permease